MADCPQHTINQATGHKLDHRTRNGVVPVIVNIDVHRFGQTGDQHGDIEQKNNRDNHGADGRRIPNAGGGAGANVYRFSAGFGRDTIRLNGNEQDWIEFDASLTPADIVLIPSMMPDS